MRLVCVCTWHLQLCPSVSVSPHGPVSIRQGEETGQELTAPINKLCVPGPAVTVGRGTSSGLVIPSLCAVWWESVH